MLKCLRLAIALAAAPFVAVAQSRDSTATLEGFVRDAVDSGAVAYAEIRIGLLSARSDGLGHYRIGGIPSGDYQVTYRMLGYNATQVAVSLDAGLKLTSDVYLVRVPTLLSTMEVKGKSLRVPNGFETIYRRAAKAQGYFITREQIDSTNPKDVLEVIHSLPTVREGYNRLGKVTRIESQRCEEYAVFLNGTQINAHPYALEELLYSTPPQWIQAVEVYDSRARMPVEFQPNCGAVAIWTRGR